MVDKVKIRLAAEAAIARSKSNPISRALGLIPVVQVASPRPLIGFPCKSQFVGRLGNDYVYNLDAQGLIYSLNIEELEFNI